MTRRRSRYGTRKRKKSSATPIFKKIKYRMIAPKRRELSENHKQIIATEGRSALLTGAQIKLSVEEFARGMGQKEHKGCTNVARRGGSSFFLHLQCRLVNCDVGSALLLFGRVSYLLAFGWQSELLWLSRTQSVLSLSVSCHLLL